MRKRTSRKRRATGSAEGQKGRRAAGCAVLWVAMEDDAPVIYGLEFQVGAGETEGVLAGVGPASGKAVAAGLGARSGVGECRGGMWGPLTGRPAAPRPPEVVPVAPMALGGSWPLPVALGFLKAAIRAQELVPVPKTCCLQGRCASVGAGAEGRGRSPHGREQPGWWGSCAATGPWSASGEVFVLLWSGRKILAVVKRFLYLFVPFQKLKKNKSICIYQNASVRRGHETLSNKLQILFGYNQL